MHVDNVYMNYMSDNDCSLDDQMQKVVITKLFLFLKSVLIIQFVHPTFCLCSSFPDINFRDMLHHVCVVAYDENRGGPIKIRKCMGKNWLINYM